MVKFDDLYSHQRPTASGSGVILQSLSVTGHKLSIDQPETVKHIIHHTGLIHASSGVSLKLAQLSANVSKFQQPYLSFWQDHINFCMGIASLPIC